MKIIQKLIIMILIMSAYALSATLSTKVIYAPNKNINVEIHNQATDNENWIGIYPRGSSNAWGNVITWQWTKGKNSVNMGGLPDGSYEARLFYNNSFHLEATTHIEVDANASRVKTSKAVYGVNENIIVDTRKFPTELQAWVGIYPAGSNNDWGNVVDWNWAQDKKIIMDALPKGKYEVRLFFHNSFKLEASYSFEVGDNIPQIHTISAQYKVNDKVSVSITGALSGNKDWVGIFPKNKDNSWGNVLGWNWVENGVNILGKNAESLPIGEYEVRLFFNNEYGPYAVARASYGFKVVEEVPHNNYGEPGPYINEVNENAEEHGDYFVYYPRNHVQGAPMVLVSGYNNVHDYAGLMKYLASKGCYVVGHKTRTNEGWSDPMFRIHFFETAFADAKNLKVDTSRLVTMGSSTGGMVSYKIMEYFKNKGYGAKKSFIIDIQGWYASEMSREALHGLDIDASLIFQMGGDKSAPQNIYNKDGSIKYHLDQDPRTLLTISKLLNPAAKKSFIVLDTTNHSYASGTYAEILEKHKLIDPIDKILKYEFFNSDGKYNDVETTLFNIDTYNATRQRVYDATIAYLDGDTSRAKSRSKYGDLRCPEGNGFDYCVDHGLQ